MVFLRGKYICLDISFNYKSIETPLKLLLLLQKQFHRMTHRKKALPTIHFYKNFNRKNDLFSQYIVIYWWGIKIKRNEFIQNSIDISLKRNKRPLARDIKYTQPLWLAREIQIADSLEEINRSDYKKIYCSYIS